MADYDAVIVGGGPAGLTAGLHLSRAGHRTLLLERGTFGGNLENVDWIEDYPGFPQGIAGAKLASEMVEQAGASGLELREGEVTAIEAFSSTRWVACSGGRGWSAGVVILAGGTRFQRLGIPGEDPLLGRGVIACTPCDGGFLRDRAVAVYGSGDHALTDALHLATLAARITLLAEGPALQGSRVLQDRVRASPAIEVRYGVRLDAIRGTDRVEGVAISVAASGDCETLIVDGVAIRAGSRPNTDCLEDVVDLDPEGRVVATPSLETSAPGVLAAGDVRSGSRPRVAAAVGDGAVAAARAGELLRAG